MACLEEFSRNLQFLVNRYPANQSTISKVYLQLKTLLPPRRKDRSCQVRKSTEIWCYFLLIFWVLISAILSCLAFPITQYLQFIRILLTKSFCVQGENKIKPKKKNSFLFFFEFQYFFPEDFSWKRNSDFDVKYLLSIFQNFTTVIFHHRNFSLL